MKWLKSRNLFLNEAKIKDVILPKQSMEIKKVWGEKWLEMEEIIPTNKIEQGVWKLSSEDKKKVLGAFFGIDMESIQKEFESLPDRFKNLLKESINIELIEEGKRIKFEEVISNFDINDPSLDEIYLFYENIFRKLSVSETKSDEIILRDENGRPVMDENNRPKKVGKEKGEPVFSNNLVNLYSFIEDYNRCYDDAVVDYNFIVSLRTGSIYRVKNLAADDLSGADYKIDISFGIFQKDIYLSILHNPKDILNMSITKFYSSCQHLYTGGWRDQVLGNVFDPNSIPAYLKFDAPIYHEGEKISDQVPLSRVMIRNVESFDRSVESKIFFDRVYPDRGIVPSVMYEMIEKYSKNKRTLESAYGKKYIFSPDIPSDEKIKAPYMDKLDIETANFIGKNTKSLNITSGYDWSRTFISPGVKLKELVVQTTDIPQNLLDINLNLDWVKFKFIDIKTLKDFKIKTSSFAFDKCKISQSVLEEIKGMGVSKLQFISCELEEIDLSIFGTLDELYIIYTLDDKTLSDFIGDLKINKLVISGDLMSDKDNKKYLSALRKNGVKVEVEGLKL
jgi:hypothetical protein